MGTNQTPRKSPKSKKTSAITTVFFDAGNTLLRPHPSVGHLYARTARRHGVRLPVSVVEARFQEAWKGRHSVDKLKNDRAEKLWWKDVVHRVMGEHFTPSAFRTFFNDLYGSFAHPAHWRLFQDALPTIRALRQKGRRVAILSNWDSRLVQLSESIGLTREVDFVMISSLEGLVKPDRRLFHRALKKANANPEETLHVGDSLREDYHGATGAGLSALLLDRQGVGPAGVNTIQSLREVLHHT